MNKKDFLLQVLQKLESDWPAAEGLKVLIQQGDVTNEVMDSLIRIIRESAADASVEKTKKRLIQGATLLEEIQAKERESKKLDQQEIDALEKQLADL